MIIRTKVLLQRAYSVFGDLRYAPLRNIHRSAGFNPSAQPLPRTQTR
jgi:hypothetical protein